MKDIASEIETLLRRLPFVQWDRYTSPDGYVFNLFGWIAREKDAYKDFVLLQYWPDDSQWSVFTSSKIHSEEIGRLLGAGEGDHEDCKRIETLVSKRLKNVIRL